MRSWRTWWSRRSVRARIVLSAAGPLAAALVVGTVALALLFSGGRLRDVDAQTRAEAESLVALVESSQLPPVLPLPAGSALQAQVLAADGTVLAATATASRIQPLVGSGGGPGVLTDERGSYAGVPLRIRMTTARLDGAPVRVVVAAPLDDVRRALRALRLVLVLVVPLLLLGATAVVWWVTGLALRPVERLRSAAAEQAADPARTPATALPVSGTDDEIARLGATLNQLLASLRLLVSRQEGLVADAAHELRSPVTSMRVQLDVAEAHPEDVHVPALLGDLGHEVDRLAALTDDLLLLARAEARHDVGSAVVDLTELAASHGEQLLVRGDAAALRRLVDNLRSNAQRHGTTVQMTTSVVDGDAVLDVDDDGPGIPEADRERVFERWVRLDQSRARPGGGNGLGLALVREIARSHGGDVAVLTSPSGGARLRVRLPLAQRVGPDLTSR
jgi:signal transduction histidine kinase